MRWLLLALLLGCSGQSCSSYFRDRDTDAQILQWSNQLELEVQATQCIAGINRTPIVEDPKICTVVLQSGTILRVECSARGCEIMCGGS